MEVEHNDTICSLNFNSEFVNAITTSDDALDDAETMYTVVNVDAVCDDDDELDERDVVLIPSGDGYE